MLPQGPYPAFVNGGNTVPVLIGGQRDEYRALMTVWPTRSVPDYTQEQYVAYVRSQYKDHADAVLAVYPWPDNPTRYTGTYLVAKLRTDSAGLSAVGSYSTQKLTEAIAAHAPVWRYAAKAIEVFGRFDTWVNDAGAFIYGRLDTVPLEDQRRLFDVTYWGMVHGTLIAAEQLKRTGAPSSTLTACWGKSRSLTRAPTARPSLRSRDSLRHSGARRTRSSNRSRLH